MHRKKKEMNCSLDAIDEIAMNEKIEPEVATQCLLTSRLSLLQLLLYFISQFEKLTTYLESHVYT